MAKLKGNLMFSSEKRKQPNENSNLQTRKIFEVFHLSYYRWARLKERKRKFAGVPTQRAMAMWKHSQPHLADANDTCGFQYFPLQVLKNGFFLTHRTFLFLPWPFCSSLLSTFWMLGEKTLLIFRNSSALRTTRDVRTEFLAMKSMPMVPTDIVVWRSRRPAYVGQRQDLEQETGSFLNASKANHPTVRVVDFQMCPLANNATCPSLQRGGCGLAVLCCNTLFIPQLRIQRGCSEQTLNSVHQKAAVGL